MLVADTSALVAALGTGRAALDLEQRFAGEDLEAPHVVDLEFLQSLRRMVRQGELNADRAGDVRTLFGRLPLTRYPHEPLTNRIWELRENLSAYDAAFVALAEILGAPLVTCDAHLAAAQNHDAEVELFALA